MVPWTPSRRRAAAAESLPDDLLAVVLERLPSRRPATSRGVCKRWRELIDDRRLLLRFLLPHSVRGLLVSYHLHDCYGPMFLSRPTYDGPRRIDAKFDFIKREHPYSRRSHQLVDHCNGLVLLLENRLGNLMHVCNPATRWSAPLPPCPVASTWGRRAFLVFDPSVSPEYKVLLSPVTPGTLQMIKDNSCRMTKWPPTRWSAWHEFSSNTGSWEEKVFVREGEAAGTAWDLLKYTDDIEPPCRYAAYWKGALYVHCHGEFVSRLSLLDDKYSVIKTPVKPEECKNHGVQSFLGRSGKGVYIAAIARDDLVKLQVWTLNECSQQTEWVSKDQRNLKINTTSSRMENNKFDEQKFWTFDFDDERKIQDVSLADQNVCWNSNDDNTVNASDDEHDILRNFIFLGFHPYKEVIFLCCDDNVVALHLNIPKVQYLGTIVQPKYRSIRRIRESFVYTPCLIEDLQQTFV